ncbi:hypothetical protein J8F10_13840 [Gemmata sp. G18]|uniref:PEP-CTERM sorting domain-containing protein n=1 Tax=Gemmata palustris TaxID=2822762 RepID=A0ABS5BRJ4_9BACT|nr:hypothetical protein [Gemmata palustris]MBP3956362.1 hypothetical protein [Gemmata palustris]
MSRTVRMWATGAAVAALLAVASPARAGFITYSFKTDSSDSGGSLTGSFQVDQADLLDGALSTSEVQNYSFTFKDQAGGTTVYALNGVFPDLAVDPLTGIPTGLGSSVLGDQIGESGLVQTFLDSQALSPGASQWFAITRPTDAIGSGTGHWEIGPSTVTPTPAPPGMVLALSGMGCLAVARRFRSRLAV